MSFERSVLFLVSAFFMVLFILVLRVFDTEIMVIFVNVLLEYVVGPDYVK